MKSDKRECEIIWAKNKYLVLSKSQNIYKEIREYLKNESVELEYLKKLIEKATSLDENSKEVVNSLNHIWGYFKRKATKEEKEKFFKLLEDYDFGKIKKEIILKYILELLKKYPNLYLENSNIFGE